MCIIYPRSLHVHIYISTVKSYRKTTTEGHKLHSVPATLNPTQQDSSIWKLKGIWGTCAFEVYYSCIIVLGKKIQPSLILHFAQCIFFKKLNKRKLLFSEYIFMCFLNFTDSLMFLDLCTASHWNWLSLSVQYGSCMI